MSKQKIEYSPASICNLFSIARTTLFRWEAVGQIPETERNEKGERVYNSAHLEKIKRLVEERTRQTLLLSRSGEATVDLAGTFCERKHAARFLFAPEKEKESELLWLKHYVKSKPLSEESLKLLSQDAVNRPVGDAFRRELLDLLIRCEDTFLQQRLQRKHRD